MVIPDQFHDLLRGLAARHFVDAEVQFRDLHTHYDSGHPNVLKAKEVFDEARAFNALMNPEAEAA